MKTMLQREQQTKLKCVHACSWHSMQHQAQVHTCTLVRFLQRKQSSCPQPVPLGNLAVLKTTTKESFHNWYHKHFFVKLEVEMFCFYCKNENRFLYINTHSTSYILLISNTWLRVDLVWTGITQSVHFILHKQWNMYMVSNHHVSAAILSSEQLLRLVVEVVRADWAAGTLQRCGMVLAVEMHLSGNTPFR